MIECYDALYIDGQWHKPTTAQTIPVISPLTEEQIDTAPLAGVEDVDYAVAAATRALGSPAWAQLSTDERAAALEAFASELEANLDDRAALTSRQNGMPISLATFAEGAGPVGILRYFAWLLRATPVEERRVAVGAGGSTVVRREPVGVLAAIIPWNFPQALTMFKLGPALAAGCTVVIKPSPETTLDAIELGAAAERTGLPPGVINIVTGGAAIGEYLVSHPGVNKVAFTGSTAAGRRVGEICGRLLRPVTLELGGKSAAIVLDDADLDLVASGLARSSLLNNGQTCYLSTRILVPQSRYDEVLTAVADTVSNMKVGDPLDPQTEIGPLASSRQQARVQSYIDSGRSSGAVAVGSNRSVPDRGWFVQPTVFGQVTNDMKIAREEIFGPVLAVIAYRGLDEAVAIANDSDYGLGGTIWTADQEKGIDVARQLQTGTVGVNFYNVDIGAPYGGIKSSGLGRELGPEGLASFQQLKSIYLP
jgi:aldehyde dehydrogenase (NAD+)